MKNLPSELYHFTSSKHIPYILKMGKLLPSSSEVLPPDEATTRIVKHPFIDDVFVVKDKNSDFKTVVLLTKDKDGNAHGNGLENVNPNCPYEHNEFRITFKFKQSFQPWHKFSIANGMPKWWRKCIEYGRCPFNWYVHEGELSIDGTTIHRRVNGEWVIFKDF